MPKLPCVPKQERFTCLETLRITVPTFICLVDFVMKFKHGNLTRRFRSAPVPNQTCAEEHGCLIEVVSKTFVELVLDNSKVC